jgi:hypothetical protein
MADINKEIMIEIRHFFLNTPLEDSQTFLWEFYTARVYHTAQVAGPNEHSDTLLFYERLRDLFESLFELLKRHKQLAENQD